MSSLFESEVHAARRRIPWADINADELLQDLTQRADFSESEVTLTVHHRPDVASRFWYSLKWKGEDGTEYGVAAQSLQLCLWRAAVRERATREAAERKGK